MQRAVLSSLLVASIASSPAFGQQNRAVESGRVQGDSTASDAIVAPTDQILSSLTNNDLRRLVAEILARNPSIARSRAKARAADLRVPQVRALPDPVAGLTAWIKRPETRTGPQVMTLSWVQSLPWLAKFDLREQAALFEASVLHSEVEATRLEQLTAARGHYYDLAFLVRYREITQDYLDHLKQHEEISRSRYATGMGASQDVVKIQAEVTLAENLLLEIDQRRVEVEAKLNRLRDRPTSTVILPAVLPRAEEVRPDFHQLVEIAGRHRPEVSGVEARIAGAKTRIKLAEKEYRPNFNVGLTYTFVDPRADAAGKLNPPDGNGDDIFGIGGGISVPLWRKKLSSGVDEASELELSARESKREVLAEIESSIGDLSQRIPLTWQQLRLLQDILIVQAEESVRSAESGYVSGTFNALDLLDAEHVLFKTEIAVARARADYATHLARLEGEIGRSLEPIETKEPLQR